jgi:molecular chaperone HtpG
VKVVRFKPESIPALSVLSAQAKNYEKMQRAAKSSVMPEEVRKLIENTLQGELTVPVTVYLNSSNSTINQLSRLPFSRDQQDACMAIYNNSVMLVNQGSTPQNAELMFKSFTRIIDRMIDQTSEIIDITSQLSTLKNKAQSKDEVNQQKSGFMIMHQTKHISCFFAMPYAGYETLLEAVKMVLEDSPYGWQVIRADDKHHEITISDNVKRHIDQAHCYISEISDGNSNVFMEIGRMGYYEDRSLIYLCRNDAEDRIPADLSGHLYFIYNSLDQKNAKLEELTEHLRKEFNRKPELANLRGEKDIYLSPSILVYHDQCDEKLAKKISSKYTSVETFLSLQPEEVAKVINVSRNSEIGAIKDAQAFLRTRFEL